MKSTRLLIPALAIALLASGGSVFAQRYDGAPYGDRDAEASLEHRGFQDGLVGADRDYQNHRRPDVNNRDEYRDPRVPAWAQHEYREGFRRGYYERVKQIYRQGPAYRYGDRD